MRKADDITAAQIDRKIRLLYNEETRAEHVKHCGDYFVARASALRTDIKREVKI